MLRSTSDRWKVRVGGVRGVWRAEKKNEEKTPLILKRGFTATIRGGRGPLRKKKEEKRVGPLEC